jgi:hypothetical protein
VAKAEEVFRVDLFNRPSLNARKSAGQPANRIGEGKNGASLHMSVRSSHAVETQAIRADQTLSPH